MLEIINILNLNRFSLMEFTATYITEDIPRSLGIYIEKNRHVRLTRPTRMKYLYMKSSA
jgi:hypothetical protein